MILQEGAAFRVRGALTIATVNEALRESTPLFELPGDWELDFSAVEDVDSAAVSLMLEWLRQAELRGRPLRFANLPDNLECLLEVYGIHELLPAAERKRGCQSREYPRV